MDTLRAAMPPGSYLVLSSFRMSGPEFPELRAQAMEGEKLLEGHVGSGRWREHAEILTWFGDPSDSDRMTIATEAARRAGHGVAVLLKITPTASTARPPPPTSASPRP
jgi:hypothetical protein